MKSLEIRYQVLSKCSLLTVTGRLYRFTHEDSRFLVYYIVSSGGSSPAFRRNVLSPYSGFTSHLLYPEDGGCTFLRNVSNHLTDYTALRPYRQECSDGGDCYIVQCGRRLLTFRRIG
jgi:hypothetical protein